MQQSIISTFAVSRTGNRGAVAMLESAIDNLTLEPNNNCINVFTVYPHDDRKLPKQKYVEIFNGTPQNLVFKLIPLALIFRMLHFIPKIEKILGAEFNALNSSKLVLLIGGTTFSDAQIVKIIYNVICALPAIILNKRTMMYSQTIGPFNKKFNLHLAKWTLSKIDFVVPRGRGSFENLKKIGINRCDYFADSAFSLIISSQIKETIRKEYELICKSNQKIVGISINSIVESKSSEYGIPHNQIWQNFIDYLLNEGYFVLIIPHSIRKNSLKKHNNDLITVKQIMENIDKSKSYKIIDNDYNCKELRELVGICDYYIASRFHSMISALSNSVPVFVVGWGFQKYYEVMTEFELSEYCYDAKELKLELLINGFTRITSESITIKQSIIRNLSRVIESSQKNHSKALELLKSGQ
ncbi:MAG: polysaccharide pyruvyl transferase family protein [Candidatus Cloacimonetes bacterium]|nr:polysaccharide pyruvyl transferase family protein [Candidatus Cloacimonadota bacterium]MCF8315152.1 polysaccharide pyruvyl transferase family protein [Ignavibacteriales bacterium]MCF8435852.1 polysaccharide pyruvyl transferase family protein [Ignavibacteriales bacterium]